MSGAGLTGTLRLTWVRDGLAHVMQHAGTGEPAGTWTGLACPDHGLSIGSEVDMDALMLMCSEGEVADLVWEAPGEIADQHNRAYYAAMRAYQAGNAGLADQHWNNVGAIWSRAWAANCAALEFMQGTGLDRFAPVKPQRWITASFEHHCGPHGIQKIHIHNIVIVRLTRGMPITGT